MTSTTRRRPSRFHVLFATYAALLIVLAVWASAASEWTDPLDTSQGIPFLALAVAAPAAEIPLIAGGIGGVVDSQATFNALVVVVALAEVAALRRLLTGTWPWR